MRSLVLRMPEVATKLQVNFFDLGDKPESKNLTTGLSDLVSVPLFCPKCDKPLNSTFEKKTFRRLGHCSRCQAEYETNMKVSGEWEQLIHERKYSYLLSKLDYQVEQIKEWVTQNKSTYNAQGEEENWNANHEKFAQEVLDHFSDLRANLVAELESSRDEQGLDDSHADSVG